MISMEKNIPRVLVVDDEPDITEVLKMGLELKGGFQEIHSTTPEMLCYISDLVFMIYYFLISKCLT